MRRLLSHLRFSLGELLIVGIVGALGFAALKTGGLFAASFLLGAVALFAGLIVAAAIGRGALQASALGFLIGSVVYGGVLYWHGTAEFDPDRGELLTTRAAGPVYSALQETYYVDIYSGRAANAGEAEAASRTPLVRMSYWQPSLVDVPLGSTLVAHVGGAYWKTDVRPERRPFMQAVHLLAASTLGYAMGKLAGALYRRRTASAKAVLEEAAPAA